MSDALLYLGRDHHADREYLLTVWPTGQMELATRSPAHQSVTWSPPVALGLTS